jgi:DNA-directed RNA polymerase I, II, and III subunit RPABC2
MSKDNDLNKIFVSSNIRTSTGKSIKFDNTAQNLYLNSNTVKKQIGGKSKPKQVQTKKVITSDDSESGSGTESDSESESDEESDIDIGNVEEVIDEDEFNNQEEPNDEETNDDETEDETSVKGVIDTEYDEDGGNEKDTEMNNEEADDCLYQYDDLIDEKDINKETYEIPKEKRMTDPIMTQYERIRILGIRTKQISMGAKPMVKTTNNISAIELAKHELNNKTTPLIIKRPLPDNSYELWKINELNNDDDDTDLILDDLNNSFDKSNRKLII